MSALPSDTKRRRMREPHPLRNRRLAEAAGALGLYRYNTGAVDDATAGELHALLVNYYNNTVREGRRATRAVTSYVPTPSPKQQPARPKQERARKSSVLDDDSSVDTDVADAADAMQVHSPKRQMCEYRRCDEDSTQSHDYGSADTAPSSPVPDETAEEAACAELTAMTARDRSAPQLLSSNSPYPALRQDSPDRTALSGDVALLCLGDADVERRRIVQVAHVAHRELVDAYFDRYGAGVLQLAAAHARFCAVQPIFVYTNGRERALAYIREHETAAAREWLRLAAPDMATAEPDWQYLADEQLEYVKRHVLGADGDRAPVVHSAQMWRALSYVAEHCPIALNADGTSYDDAKLSVRVRAVIATRWTAAPLLSADEIHALAAQLASRGRAAELAVKTLHMMCPDAAQYDADTNELRIRFEWMPDEALWDYRTLLSPDGSSMYETFYHSLTQRPDDQSEFIAFLSVHYPQAVLRRSDGTPYFDPFAVTDVVLRHYNALRNTTTTAE